MLSTYVQYNLIAANMDRSVEAMAAFAKNGGKIAA